MLSEVIGPKDMIQGTCSWTYEIANMVRNHFTLSLLYLFVYCCVRFAWDPRFDKIAETGRFK